MQNELLAGLGQTNPVLWYCSDRGEKGKAIELNGEPDIEGARNNKQGVYFCVNELGEKRNESGNLRNNANVTRPLACFADFDTGTFEEQLERIVHSPLEPSALVKSGRGYHAYWFLDGTQTKGDLERWSDVQRGIAAFFGSDDAVKDYSRIMRLPGSWHCKGEEPVLVTLEKCDPTLRYSLEEIALEFPAPTKSGTVSEIERLLTGITGKGGRNTGATRVVGILLRHLPVPQWEPVGWPMLQAWNQKQCVPPDDERTLRSTFDSISRTEKQKRLTTDKGFVTFDEDEMSPQIKEEDGAIVVRIAVEDGVAQFSFSDITQTKPREMDATVSVLVLVPGSHPKPFVAELHMMSNNSREGFARSLGKSFGKELSWDMLLSTATIAAVEHFQSRDRSIDLRNVSDQEAPVLFAPFIVKRGANLLFGDGGLGKTYLALRLAISVAMDVPFLGYTPNESCPVLFLDYEDCEEEASYRLTKLCHDPALHLDPAQVKARIRYLNPGGTPIYGIVPALKRIIKEHKIGLVLLDSVAAACGGDASDAETPARVYGALQSLGISSLSLAHITKGAADSESKGSQDKAYGSAFWHNLARNTWNIQGEKDGKPTDTLEGMATGQYQKEIGLFHRKFNNGPKSHPLHLRMVYNKNYTRYEAGDANFWSMDGRPKVDLDALILERLKRIPEMTTQQLVDALRLDAPAGTVRNHLTELSAKRILRKDAKRGGGYSILSDGGKGLD